MVLTRLFVFSILIAAIMLVYFVKKIKNYLLYTALYVKFQATRSNSSSSLPDGQ